MNNWLIAECDGKESIKAILDFLLQRFMEIFGAETMETEICIVFNDINAGLQLYSIRRETINKIWKHQFDDVFWDIPLLFDEKLFDEFANIGMENNQLNRLKTEINWFEDELKIILPESKQIIIVSQILTAKIQKEYDGLENSIKKILVGITNNELALDSVENYVGNLKKADDLQRIVDAKTLQLVMKLREFTRNSIQQK